MRTTNDVVSSECDFNTKSSLVLSQKVFNLLLNISLCMILNFSATTAIIRHYPKVILLRNTTPEVSKQNRENVKR